MNPVAIWFFQYEFLSTFPEIHPLKVVIFYYTHDCLDIIKIQNISNVSMHMLLA